MEQTWNRTMISKKGTPKHDDRTTWTHSQLARVLQDGPHNSGPNGGASRSVPHAHPSLFPARNSMSFPVCLATTPALSLASRSSALDSSPCSFRVAGGRRQADRTPLSPRPPRPPRAPRQRVLPGRATGMQEVSRRDRRGRVGPDRDEGAYPARPLGRVLRGEHPHRWCLLQVVRPHHAHHEQVRMSHARRQRPTGGEWTGRD